MIKQLYGFMGKLDQIWIKQCTIQEGSAGHSISNVIVKLLQKKSRFQHEVPKIQRTSLGQIKLPAQNARNPACKATFQYSLSRFFPTHAKCQRSPWATNQAGSAIGGKPAQIHLCSAQRSRFQHDWLNYQRNSFSAPEKNTLAVQMSIISSAKAYLIQ